MSVTKIFKTQPFTPILPSRSREAIATLRRMIGHLPISLDLQTAAVCGGSVARTLLGSKIENHVDLDLFVARDRFGEVEQIFEDSWIDHDGEDSSSTFGGRRIFERFGVRVDLVECASVPDALARFDVRAAAVATDGNRILATGATIADLRRRRLYLWRPTTPFRIRKYLDLGLDLSADCNADTASDRWGVEGVTIPYDSEPGDWLGTNLEVRFEVVDNVA